MNHNFSEGKLFLRILYPGKRVVSCELNEKNLKCANSENTYLPHKLSQEATGAYTLPEQGQKPRKKRHGTEESGLQLKRKATGLARVTMGCSVDSSRPRSEQEGRFGSGKILLSDEMDKNI